MKPILMSVALIVLSGSALHAQTANKPDDPEAMRGLDEAVTAFTKAYNAGDARAVAETFTENALVITEDDERIEGRDAIEETFSNLFAAFPGSTISIQAGSRRLLSPQTALEEGTALVQRGSDAEPEITRFRLVYVKEKGRWLQAFLRDEPDEPATPHERLKALEWLLGEWVHESPEAVVFTSCKWDEDGGNFLVRSFTVQIAGQPLLKGSQRIGWDPLTRQVKSWVFDASGGTSEGYWSRSGNQWLVKATGTRADGQVVTATQIITPLSKDRISWRSVDRTEGGTAVAEIDEIILVRKPPNPGR